MEAQTNYQFGYTSEGKLLLKKDGKDIIELSKEELEILSRFLEQIGMCRIQYIYKQVEVPVYPINPTPIFPGNPIIWYNNTTGSIITNENTTTTTIIS